MGLLLVKELILVDKNVGIRAGHIRLRGLPYLQVTFRMTHTLMLVRACPSSNHGHRHEYHASRSSEDLNQCQASRRGVTFFTFERS
jgi:hypothetical protein